MDADRPQEAQPVDQRLMALDRANAARTKMAQLRARIKRLGARSGAREAARVVMAGESPIEFERLLCDVRRIGRKEAGFMLDQAQINGAERVNSERVPMRRRERLAGELIRYAERHNDRPAA